MLQSTTGPTIVPINTWVVVVMVSLIFHSTMVVCTALSEMNADQVAHLHGFGPKTMSSSSISAISRIGSRLPLLLIFLAPSAMGCNTPVYRYALEHWMPQPYELVVFRHGKP